MRARRVLTALTWGALNHALFGCAITAMVLGLHGGLRIGAGTLHGPPALAANAALALQFPLLHSWMLTRSGRRALERLAPGGFGRELVPTTFAALASVQVLATFLLWSPSGVVLYEATGWTLWIWNGLFAASWSFLVKALYDARLSVQTGSIGWVALLRGRPAEFGSFPVRGLFRSCRQPVYLAFALTLWTGPTLTLDRLLLAALWTAYCLVGPLHKERRYLEHYGDAYSEYRRRVPYILPGSKP
jgi:protein-S-isoprenylcysteine O-methyltransferase Ste14